LKIGVSREDTFSNASSCHTPNSEEAGGVFSQEILDNFGVNLHRCHYFLRQPTKLNIPDLCRCRTNNLAIMAAKNLMILVLMGLGLKLLTWVESFFYARVGLGQPSLNLKNSPQKSQFFNFFPFGSKNLIWSGQKILAPNLTNDMSRVQRDDKCREVTAL